MSEIPKKAVILVSGGLDSTTVLALAINEGFDVFALTFDYGQRHKFELEAARAVAHNFKVKKHFILRIPLEVIGGSALTEDIPVPRGQCLEKIGSGEVPITYVPARNTIFLSYAVAWCEVLDAQDVFIGVNAIDFSGYPDCRPEFIECFEQVACLGTKDGSEGKHIRIHAPFIHMTKADIIKTGVSLGVDYGMTHSCYNPGQKGEPCGNCDSCLLRKRGFQEAGFFDPLCRKFSCH